MSKKQRITDFIETKFLFQNARDFEHFQQKLLRATILVYLIASIILVPMSVSRASVTGWVPLYAVHLINLLLFTGLHFMRHRLPYQMKAIMLICIFYSVTVTGIVHYGVEDSYNLYFGLCIILSAIFLRFSQTLMLIIIIIVTQIVLFIALLNQWITPNINLVSHQDKIASWLSSEIAFISLFLTAIIALGSLNQYLQKTIKLLNVKQKELLNAQKELKELALKDPLTKLHNRRAFDTFLKKEFAHFKRASSPFCLLVIDLDLFKSINDNYGHHVGDLVLQACAACLQQQVRDDELVARIGGEEFVVLLSKCSVEQAMLAAERMRAAIEALDVEAEQQTIKVTSSIGVAQISSDDPDTKLLFTRADQALYQAKQTGRNRVIKA